MVEATAHVTLSTPARILIVDDHPNTASMLARVLGKFDTPVEVLTARSGEEALELAYENPVDILITDFLMSGINGLDLVERLRGEREPAHKILITAYDTPGLVVAARGLKVQDVLIKPVQPERVREIVAKVLQDIRPPRRGPAQRQFKILIADDYLDNIRLLAARLKNEGYLYTTAEDGDEVLRKVRSEQPDLVLLDVNMPKKDGFQVLGEIRSDPAIATLPVIIITAARLTTSDIREGLTLGADDYITKPFDWRELSVRIRNKLRVKEAEDNLRLRNQELELYPALSQELGEHLGQVPDVEALTKSILSRAAGALGASNGFLLVFHPDGSLTYQMHHLPDLTDLRGTEELPPTEYNRQTSRLPGMINQLHHQGLVTRVIRERKGVIIEDTKVGMPGTEERWVDIPGVPIRSAIAVPLLGRSEVLAVLVLTHNQSTHFTSEHLSLLTAISSQAAIAIENAQLFAVERKRVDELVALNQLTHEINRFTHCDEVFDRLPHMLCGMMGFPAAALWLVESAPSASNRLVLKSLAGVENTVRLHLLEIGPIQAMAARKPIQLSGPVVKSDAAISSPPPGEGPRTRTLETTLQSVIAVPISWNDQVGGVLSIHSRRAGAFQESDRVLLEMLAAHIANALERMRLFESVERGQKRLSAVLNGAADAILVLDGEGRLELANPTGQRLFTDVDARTGQNLPLQHGYDALINLLDQAQHSNTPIQGEVAWPDERTFSALVSPLEEGGQVALLHDISHFKALDQLKNELVATASHDLKNPIATILGYSSLLSKAGPLNEMQVDFTQRICNAAVRMQDLVLNLLDMARMDMGVKMDMEVVDLHLLLKQIGEELSGQVQEKGQILDYQLALEPALIWGDRIRLQQVARNLVDNAIKYTSDGGQITVSSQIVDGVVITKIQDTGIGIPAEALPKLFSKFFRVRTEETEDIQGNGLGLAIVKSIIEKHGGRITVESTPGKGSLFCFLLNRYRPG